MHTQDAQTYVTGPGANQVTLTLTVDDPELPVTASVVEQTPEKVVVRVEVANADMGDGPVTGVGIDVNVVVDLDSPLGSRPVVNDSGLTLVTHASSNE